MDISELRAVALANRQLHLLGLVDEGIDCVPTEGAWMLEKGERVTRSTERRGIDTSSPGCLDWTAKVTFRGAVVTGVSKC